jgi:hypothetical protein
MAGRSCTSQLAGPGFPVGARGKAADDPTFGWANGPGSLCPRRVVGCLHLMQKSPLLPPAETRLLDVAENELQNLPSITPAARGGPSSTLRRTNCRTPQSISPSTLRIASLVHDDAVRSLRAPRGLYLGLLVDRA